MRPQERRVAWVLAGLVVIFIVYLSNRALSEFPEPAPPSVTTVVEPKVSAAEVTVPGPVAASTTSLSAVVVDAGRPRPSLPTVQHSGGVWYALGDCESGEWAAEGDPSSAVPGSARWDLVSKGYEGGLRWLHATWVQAGGRAYAEHANDATAEEQIMVARFWLGRTSVLQWPTCGPAMGLNKDRDGIKDGDR